ncbi:MAG: exodeoxyribonuclease VII large subunit [Pseudohongiellaceae bacterium]|jgi:exodeoxyribonuclease VII large subunit
MSKIARKQDDQVLSVGQLNRLAKQLLEDHFPAVHVQGEISNLSQPASGHWYFTLKDQQAQVRCAMFRNRNLFVRSKPRDGMQVVVKARLSLYEGRGDYQLLVESLEDGGTGALRQAFERLFQKLQAEGLFAEGRKKPLPSWPRHVAIITSPTGAAVRDVISVFRRRFPGTLLTVIPVSVQGQTAAGEMVQALALVNRREGVLQDVDTILLARGGGSLEDLWSFNDEALARAIAASVLPTVSAVGHEVDFTIADFIADVRAATPSAAAELLSPQRQALLLRLFDLRERQRLFIQQRLRGAQTQLAALGRRLRHPGRRLQEHAQRLDQLEARLGRALRRRLIEQKQRAAALHKRLALQSPQYRLPLQRQDLLALQRRAAQALRALLSLQRQRLATQSQALQAISPLATLARGYSLTTDASGHVLTSVDGIRPGATIETRLATGSLRSTVVSSTPGEAVTVRS